MSSKEHNIHIERVSDPDHGDFCVATCGRCGRKADFPSHEFDAEVEAMLELGKACGDDCLVPAPPVDWRTANDDANEGGTNV